MCKHTTYLFRLPITTVAVDNTSQAGRLLLWIRIFSSTILTNENLNCSLKN